MVFVNFVFVNFEQNILQVEEMVKKLQQEARDGVEEKKIGERKSVAMVRSAILLNSNFYRKWKILLSIPTMTPLR